MFRAIWSKTLRDYRVPILGWGIGLGLLLFVGFVTATPVILASYATLAQLFRFLGDGYAIQTPEGYITFRYMGLVVPLMLSFWPILAAARLVRGEEERGSLDVVLATPQPRTRLLLEKVVALLLALILIGVLIALGAVIGEVSAKDHVDVVRALLLGLNLSLLTFFFGMVALLLSQLTTSRGAAAAGASGVLLLALLLQITGNVASGSWIQHLSPFYYYSLNRPLIPSYPNQPWEALVLVVLSLLCLGLSLALFVRRDIGRAAFSWRFGRANDNQRVMRSLSRAEHAVSTQTVGLHELSMKNWTSFWWLLGIGIFSVYCLFLALSIQEQFTAIVQKTPFLQQLFFDTPYNTNAALLGTILFTFIPALVVVFAMVLALSWSADLENGRLELILSTPESRPRMLLERFGAQVLLILPAPILTWLVLIIGARLANLDVNQGRLIAASVTMLPPALITMGLVYAVAGRLRHAVVLSGLTVYLVLAYLEETLEGSIQMPQWLMSLSIFHLYGNPVFLGMNWGNFLGMLGVSIVLLVIGLIQFRTADISLG